VGSEPEAGDYGAIYGVWGTWAKHRSCGQCGLFLSNQECRFSDIPLAAIYYYS